MNRILREIIQTQSTITPDKQTVPLNSHIPELDGVLLQSWLGEYRPKRLLEIGLAYGISSLYICETISAWSVAHYHIIDPHQSTQWQNAGVHGLERAGYGDLFELHESYSELCLPQLLQEKVRFDFAFVDGMHTFDHALVDFFYINRMLEVGGIVLFDDSQLPSIQKVLAHIDGYECYERLQVPQSITRSKKFRVLKMAGRRPIRICGFVKIDVDRRDWDWFRDF